MTKYQLPLFEDPTLLPTGKQHVSYSEISDWMDCSYRHRLKHIEKIGIGKPSIHTEYGQVIHDVLENYILGKHELNEETIATATDAFQKLCGELKEKHNINVSDKDIKDFSASIPEIVNSVPAFLDETFPGWTGFAAEHALYESVAGQTNKWFKGFIDTVIRIPKNSRKGKKTSAPEDNEGATVMRLSELVKQVKPGEENQEFGDGYEFWIIDWKTTSWGWDAMKKRDFQKQLQLIFYKHYFCRLLNLRLDQVKCGFVLLKRTPRKSDNSRCELVTVSVGPKTETKALEVLNNMINQVSSGRAIKNRNSCRFCDYNGTEHCT
jgi:hypothetical protein